MESKTDIKGLAHIGVFLDDIDKSVAFYTDILGFECYHRVDIEENGGITRIAFVKKGTCIIEIVQPGNAGGKADGRVNHIAMQVEDIDAQMAILKQKGIVFETESAVTLPAIFNGVKYAMFRGPDNERLEIMQLL